LKTIELTSCPACGSERSETISLGGQAELLRCLDCGTVRAPAYADHDEVFEEGYMRGEASFGLDFDILHPRCQELLAGINERRMELLEKTTGGPGRLIDVGCGTGELLAVARDRGWNVIGIDPVADQAEHARSERQLDVRAATLEEFGKPEHPFDAVTAFHVLEHMPEPIAFARGLSEIARPGGSLMIEVPNFDSLERKRRGPRWGHLRPLEHLVHYTPDSLRRVLESAGLEQVTTRTVTWVGPPQSLHEAAAGLAEPRLARWLKPLCAKRTVDGHEVRVPGRMAWAALRAYAAASERRGAGATVLATARVPG
jgi:2-polyprenyl-3-methyl-5-hydroxy-6-metoxy-1,4-benzoquinol methylase